MLTTGIRTPVGLKISGADTAEIEQIGARVEYLLRSVRGTRSVFAERTSGGYFLDFVWNREVLARYGLSIDDAQTAVQNAIGRREHHHHYRRTRALPRECTLHARFSL
jgi:Cu(I)/Ag(I) efflux system membrane protein CusA/SilA